MKAMKAVVRISTYPVEESPRFIMFPVSRMHLLLQIQLPHTLNAYVHLEEEEEEEEDF